eukprot:scaffold383367_cov255-Cyclotella_meneghiniana.AAC.1
MPTNEAIDNARLRGAIARNAADQQLLNPDQRAQNPADAALPFPLTSTRKYRRRGPTLLRRIPRGWPTSSSHPNCSSHR